MTYRTERSSGRTTGQARCTTLAVVSGVIAGVVTIPLTVFGLTVTASPTRDPLEYWPLLGAYVFLTILLTAVMLKFAVLIAQGDPRPVRLEEDDHSE